MELQHVLLFFNAIAFLFAISVHESAHAWMANLRGDPTAKMLGRVTLNPIRHIDPIGTIVMPAIAILTGVPMLGWAKPVPVDPRNFKNEVLDDILTSAVGPVSNFFIAICTVIVLVVLAFISPEIRELTGIAIQYGPGALLQVAHVATFTPVVLLLYTSIYLNVLLGVFNLFPVPPLDGSHVFRHFLPERIRDIYDRLGIIGLFALILFGGPVIAAVMGPVLHFFDRILFNLIA